jgi:hypothetical protein
MTKIYAAFGGAQTLPGAVAAGVTEAPNLGSACRALVVSLIASAVTLASSCSAAIASTTLTSSTARLDEKGDARIVLQADGLDANPLQDQDLLNTERQTIRAQVTGANLVAPTTPARSCEQLMLQITQVSLAAWVIDGILRDSRNIARNFCFEIVTAVAANE